MLQYIKDKKEYKVTMRIGVRELAGNVNILDGYDYVEVEDQKTHEYKGLFISMIISYGKGD